MINFKRLDYLDYAKGIGILLVVLAHIYTFNPNINRQLLVVWIYSFHMPLFFIISGMLVQHKNIKLNSKTFFNRIKGIIIPYFMFSLITIIVRIILYGFNFNNVLLDIICTIVGFGLDALWFLPALFIGELLFLIINKFIKNDYMKKIIIIISFFIATFMSKENGLIFSILNRSVIALGFISIGYYFYDFINNKTITILGLIILFPIQILLSKINGFVDLNNLVFNNRFLYTVNSLLGTIIILQISKKLTNINILKYFGSNSIIILGLHMNLIFLFRKFIKLNLHSYDTGLILFIGILLIEVPIITLYNLRKSYNKNLKLN